MLRWLKKNKPGESKTTAQEMSDFLNDVHGKASVVVPEVTRHFAETVKERGLDLATLLAADGFVRPYVRDLEAAMFSPDQGSPELTSHVITEYCATFGSAYLKAFFEPSAEKPEPLVALRAMALLAMLRRFCRIGNREVSGSVHLNLLRVFVMARKIGVADAKFVLYPKEDETSVTLEYAVSSLFESAPFESLAREQSEFFWRYLRHSQDRIPVKTVSGGLTPFPIGEDGKTYAKGVPKGMRAICHVGPGIETFDELQSAAVAKTVDGLPYWTGNRIYGTELNTVRMMARRVVSVWRGEITKRRAERQAGGDMVLVAQGFDHVRRMVAYSSYVRSGGTLDVFDSHRLREAHFLSRFSDEGISVSELKNHEPIEILTELENAGAKSSVENWQVTDRSEIGIGLVIPGYRRWLSVGHLMSVREEGKVEWRVGVIRRISTIGGVRSVGIEYLSGSAVPVGIRTHQKGGDRQVNWSELVDGILLKGDSHGLITRNTYPDGSYLLSFGGGKSHELRVDGKMPDVTGAAGYFCTSDD